MTHDRLGPARGRFLLRVALGVASLWGCPVEGSRAPAPVAAPPESLPPAAARRLRESLAAASRHRAHVWRDTAPLNADGTLTGYVEIAQGERTKWEFDIAANTRAVDRVIDAGLGGYPVNYGFVPQTLSFDGDPFDVLVLGPPLLGGSLVRGRIVGVLYMDDEKGHDMKVVMSPVDARGQPTHPLTPDVQAQVGAWFERYKLPERAEGKWSRVLGWGSAGEGRRLVDATHRFFEDGRR